MRVYICIYKFPFQLHNSMFSQSGGRRRRRQARRQARTYTHTFSLSLVTLQPGSLPIHLPVSHPLGRPLSSAQSPNHRRHYSAHKPSGHARADWWALSPSITCGSWQRQPVWAAAPLAPTMTSKGERGYLIRVERAGQPSATESPLWAPALALPLP